MPSLQARKESDHPSLMELKTNLEWREWGHRDPLFGVANCEGKDVGGAAPWTDQEFYALGESDWRDFSEHWRRYGYASGTFLEIGCGAGRITKHLSAAFHDGYAVDVSEDMIQYAATRLATANVEWRLTQGLSIPVNDSSIDGAFSCHVFQHLPSVEAGCAYFREIFRVLKPGGTLMVHLPIHSFPTMVSQKFASGCAFLYGLLLPVVAMKSECKRFLMRHGGTPPMHGVSYPQERLYQAMLEMGFARIEFEAFPVRSNGALHSFVLATKPDIGSPA
jgi:ubiquinone/menaquinone biosynthesis C-methylase UbiE